MNSDHTKEYWSNEKWNPPIDEYTPKDEDDLSKGLVYLEFNGPLMGNMQENQDQIKMIRGFARNMKGKARHCYEQFRRRGDPGYKLLVPHVSLYDYQVFKDLNVDVKRVYRPISRKQRRKHYYRVIL